MLQSASDLDQILPMRGRTVLNLWRPILLKLNFYHGLVDHPIEESIKRARTLPRQRSELFLLLSSAVCYPLLPYLPPPHSNPLHIFHDNAQSFLPSDILSMDSCRRVFGSIGIDREPAK